MRFLTAGESHGPGVIAVIDGVPAGLAVSSAEIDLDLRRRQLGYGRGARQKIERDEVRITGGVRQGRTTGAPIALQILNRDAVNWERVMSVEPVAEPPDAITRLRPGHADLAGALKFGHEDVRDVIERASARETAARVAAGAVAKAVLKLIGIEVRSETKAIGAVESELTLARGKLGPTDLIVSIGNGYSQGFRIEADRAVKTRGSELSGCVRRKTDRADGWIDRRFRNQVLPHPAQIVLLQVPDPDPAVVTDGIDELQRFAGIERHTELPQRFAVGIGPGLEGVDDAAVVELPDPHHAGGAGRCQKRAVGPERQRIDRVLIGP